MIAATITAYFISSFISARASGGYVLYQNWTGSDWCSDAYALHLTFEAAPGTPDGE
jgi:hypothetical protein